MSAPAESAHPHSLMTSHEVDVLVHSYLVESGYMHTSFSLVHESSIAAHTLSSANANANANARKHPRDDPDVPPGHLVRILQKGLLYLQAEARYRGDPVEPAPRLVGYPIPNALPLPPLPKHQPLPPTQPPTPNPETPAPKDKGKGKETTTAGGGGTKRKGRAGSDRDEGDGKRPRTASGDKTTKVAAAPGSVPNGAGEAMDVEQSPSVEPEPTAEPQTAIDDTPAPPPVPVPAEPTPPNPTALPLASASQPAPAPAPAQTPLVPIPAPPPIAIEPPTPVSAPATALHAPPAPALIKAEEKEEGEETEEDDVLMKRPNQDDEEEGALQEDVPPVSAPAVSVEGVVELTEADSAVVKLRGHTMPKVQPCSWNPKVPALLATGGGDSTCRIWDVPAPGDPTRLVKEHVVCKHSSAQRRVDVAAVAWDPSGSLLATGSEDGIARIWTPSGDLHLVLSMHQRTIFSLKWNTLGTMLLTGSLDNTVCLWEVNSGKVKQQWSSHSDSVLDVDWNDDQTFASASMDKSIHLFDVRRISPVHRFKGHRDEVNVVKFSPCGTLLASCSDDKSVRIWSLRHIPGFPLERSRDGPEEGRVIDDRDHAGSFVLEGHDKDVHTLAWAPWEAGQKGPRLLASASFDAKAKLWDADLGTCLHTFARHSDYVYSIAFSPNSGAFLVTGSDDGKMCVWNVKERRLVLEYTNAGPIYEVAWNPAGTQLAVCGRTEDVAVVAFDAAAALA